MVVSGRTTVTQFQCVALRTDKDSLRLPLTLYKERVKGSDEAEMERVSCQTSFTSRLLFSSISDISPHSTSFLFLSSAPSSSLLPFPPLPVYNSISSCARNLRLSIQITPNLICVLRAAAINNNQPDRYLSGFSDRHHQQPAYFPLVNISAFSFPLPLPV